MDIDMAALRALEHEKDISFDVVVEAIETALLSAYHKTHGARAQARVELDRKTGHVTVWARERLDDEREEPAAEPGRAGGRRGRSGSEGDVRAGRRAPGAAVPRSSTTRRRTSAASPPPSHAS